MIADGMDVLLRSQNTDGGWGVSAGRGSNTETTSFALLGLRAAGWTASRPSVARGLQWLSGRQNDDGSWPLAADTAVGRWTTPLAILAVAAFDRRAASVARGTEWLVRQEGRRLGWLQSLAYRVMPAQMSSRIDPDLVGWSWTPDAFGWVEPTAHALLALKRVAALGAASSALADRIRLGERFLYDRMCEGGGWNHGNPQVFGVDAPPYPDVTALALIALHERRDTAPNQKSLDELIRMLTEAESGLTLSLSIICLALSRRPITGWQQRLAEVYRETMFLGGTKALALALIAMSGDPEVLTGSTS